MLVLVFYVPESHLESVKSSLFAAGAGKIGAYSCCCWQIQGEGQFRPEEGSIPYTGIEGTVSRVEEYRVEMVCEEACAQKVKDALLSSHPYEMPAWHFIKASDTI